MFTILVAYDENRVIGNEGRLPWDLPKDLKLFKERTLDNIVIMGRKTWESLPVKPLPKRLNIVVSKSWNEKLEKSGKWEYSEFYVRPSLEKACFFARLRAESYIPKKEIYIIGGAMIYEAALNSGLVDKIIVSKIHGVHEGDVYFPELSEGWNHSKLEEYDGFDLLEYSK